MGNTFAPFRHTWSPIGWPGFATAQVDANHWGLDTGTRLGSGDQGGSNAYTGSPGGTPGGDYPPIRPSKVAGPMPFTFQPGGARRAGFGAMQHNGQFVPSYDPSHGHQGSQGGTTGAGVYGPGQIGGPAQIPNQPYRASAGFRVLAYTPVLTPQRLPAQLAGGPKGGMGVVAGNALTSQIAAILSARKPGGRTPNNTPTVAPSTLAGRGVGSRGGQQLGMSFNRAAAMAGTQPGQRR